MSNEASKQIEEASSQADFTPDRYIKGRVDQKVEAYRSKGERYRWAYLLMASVATAGAASVPVLINIDGVHTNVPTVVSLLVTILVGLEGLLRFREHWRNYDLIKSVLRQEKSLYLAAAGVYKQSASPRERFSLFVERVEAEIAKERTQTIDMRTARQIDRNAKPGDESRRYEFEKPEGTH